jgi:hypothetical protein
MVPHPPGSNVVMSKWYLGTSFVPTVHWSTTRLTCHVRALPSSLVMSETVHTILSLPISRDLLVHELDIKNAFPHGNLSEVVYYSQPMGFDDPAHPNYI